MVQCVDKNTREICSLSPEDCDHLDHCEISPDISVVIPALNELYNIPNTIESLQNQVTEFDYEIVVADNGSTDGTREYLNKMDGVKVVKADKKGISIARNTASRASSAPYILQTDADVVVPEDWIQRMGEKLINDGQDIVAGSVAFESENRIQRWITSAIYGMGLRLYNEVQGILPIDLGRIHSGANMGFSRKVFDEVGGYNEEQKWFESGDFTSEAQKRGARIKFVHGDPVITSSRRFGDNLVSTAARLAHTGSVSLLKMMGIEHEVDYERVD